MPQLASATPPTFFNRTYDEAMSLMVEARNYLSYGEQRDRCGLQPMDRLVLSCETMRLTSRLTQVMAWLLVRKAVHAGEMTEAEAASEAYRLSGHAVCGDTSAFDGSILPRPLRSLLMRSHHLYQRVSRLDALVAGQGGADCELSGDDKGSETPRVVFIHRGPDRRRLN